MGEICTCYEEDKSTELLMKALDCDDVNNQQFKVIESKFKTAFNKIEKKNKSKMSLSSFSQLVMEIKPNMDSMVLFLRWARKIPNNFNHDSMSLVMTISGQCGCSAVKLLNEVFTYYILPSQVIKRRTCNLYTPYGIQSIFKATKSYECDKSEKEGTNIRLQKQLMPPHQKAWALAITFAVLDFQARKTNGSFVASGMTQSRNRNVTKKIANGLQVLGVATQQIHKSKSFYKRVMVELSH